MTSTDPDPQLSSQRPLSESLPESNQQPLKKIKLMDNDGNESSSNLKAANAPEVHESSKESPVRPESKKETLSEGDVFINTFLSSNPGFTAIIKHRFSDFHVSEVDTMGRVVTLKNLKAPEVSSTSTSKQTDDKTDDQNVSHDKPWRLLLLKH
jgi:hypothetical protein